MTGPGRPFRLRQSMRLHRYLKMLQIGNSMAVDLLDLPSELLQMIASLLDNSSQLQLGLTCKILNHISLDTFFKQNDVHLPEYNLFSGYQVPKETLWALRAALWLKPFTSIHYVPREDTLLAQIFDLYHLIKWLPKVEYLALSFPLATEVAPLRGPTLDVRRWFIAITMLLQVAIEKGCKEVTVRGGKGISSLFSTAKTLLQTLEKELYYIPG